MPRTPLRLPLAAALLAAALTLPAGAQAANVITVATAPGRIVVPVDQGAVHNDVDAAGASQAIALPDGSALMFGSGAAANHGLYAVKIGANGALDRTFGGGVVAVPAPPRSTLQQILRQADGKLLLLTSPTSSGSLALPRLQVTRLNADLTLDRAYGTDGIASTSLGAGGDAALQPDGDLVVIGTAGDLTAPPIANLPSNVRAGLTRLTPTGALDTSFGTGGVATIATTITTTGANVAIGPSGTIVAEGQTQQRQGSTMVLTRLTAAGLPDPTFAGGVPISTPFASGSHLVAGADGRVVIDGQPPSSSGVPVLGFGPQFLAGYTAGGVPDPAFGTNGIVALGSQITPTQLLPASGGGVLVAARPGPGGTPIPGRLYVLVVTPGGQIAAGQGATLDLPFGGGGSSFLTSAGPHPIPSLVQNTFDGDTLLPRAGGSYLVVGGVHVSQPTGEGTGYSIGQFAAVALTPSFAIDPSFGGPAQALRLGVALARQRATTARTRHGITVLLGSSAVGLARVKVSHGGRAIANSLLPVFTTAARRLPVQLTAYGETYLRHHRNLHVTVTAVGRDLLTNTTTARATGRLP